MRATRQKWVNNAANQLTGRPVRYLVNRLTDVCDHDDDDDDFDDEDSCCVELLHFFVISV